MVFTPPAYARGARGAMGPTRKEPSARCRCHFTSGASGLVSVTPGCLGSLCRALPGVAVTDPFELLATRANTLRFRPLARRIAVHLPCTQVNVARSESAMLSLLRQVPLLDVQPLPRPPYCCGAAGSHMLEFPARAAKLRELYPQWDAFDAVRERLDPAGRFLNGYLREVLVG